jgi:hypothetical protein
MPLDTTMTIDQFWTIVEKVHHASGGDMNKKCELLDAELRRLPLDEVRSFHAHFDDRQDLSYTWDLWAAAFIIGGGCSDDAFCDFRSTLISMGRETFERAISDPQSLADMNYDAELAHCEGYQYVPTAVENDLGGGQLFMRSRRPSEPSGEPWMEHEVADLFPKLAEKYGYAD